MEIENKFMFNKKKWGNIYNINVCVQFVLSE